MDTFSAPDIHSELTEQELQLSLEPDLMPRHVAIIMDGNGRWAGIGVSSHIPTFPARLLQILAPLD